MLLSSISMFGVKTQFTIVHRSVLFFSLSSLSLDSIAALMLWFYKQRADFSYKAFFPGDVENKKSSKSVITTKANISGRSGWAAPFKMLTLGLQSIQRSLGYVCALQCSVKQKSQREWSILERQHLVPYRSHHCSKVVYIQCRCSTVELYRD